MFRDFVNCTNCGGRREHDLRTGEVGSCDTCDVFDPEGDTPVSPETSIHVGNAERVG